MQINWKLRLQNKTTLTALIVAVVSGIYSVLTALGITPAITQDMVLAVVSAVVTILVALGIVTDPTTKGTSDSNQAMTYDEPHDDSATEGV